ncbi:MAG TPA: isoprenyl transferase [Blastocatellia bacterium]|nr:isoprenyl transferase [Blastocatellia bacterium]
MIAQTPVHVEQYESEDRFLLAQLDLTRLPRHVAVIMDGNGRWAARRSLPRTAGHRAGADAVRTAVETAGRLGLEHLTLFAFSTENWKRPRLEVQALMRMLTEFLRKELPSLRKNNIRFRMIGCPEGLTISVLEQIRRAELATMQNTGLSLNIALNYGGRQEIVEACRQLAREVARGQVSPEEISQQLISDRLYTASIPDPDLLIRTSGEMRISNFLLWQIAYSEIYVTETLWPDFDKAEFVRALLDYQGRQRRFGAVEPFEPELDSRVGAVG